MKPRQPTSNLLVPIDGLAILGLLMLAVVPYLNTLTGAFVFDDRQQILENPYVHSFQYVGKIFESAVWSFQGAQGLTDYYRPLMSLAYLLCYKLFGPAPFSFHVLNLVLHASIVLLVLALARRLFRDRLTALLAAGLFALHPIHTESVAWIAGLTDLELGFFFLLTFLLYLRLGDRPAATTSGMVGMSAMYALALFSKEQALVLPFLAASYEHFYRPERDATPLKQKLSRYSPLFLLAALYFHFRAFVLGGFMPPLSRSDLSWPMTIFSALALIGQYLWKLLWPVQLSAFYVFRASERLAEPRVIVGLVTLTVCALIFLCLWRRDRMASLAFLWMGATIAPVLNARWMPAGVFDERYLYLPSVGFCWLLAWTLAKIWRLEIAAASGDRAGARRLHLAVPVVVGIVAVFYGARTVNRNRDWRVDEILYAKTLALQPDAQIIRSNLGAIYFDRGDWAGAEREWLASLGPARPYASTLNDLGLLRARQMRYDEAISYFQRSIVERPNYMSPHKNLAKTNAEIGRDQDAEHEFRAAIALAPLSSGVHNEFAKYLVDRGRSVEAQEQYAVSAQVDPNSEAQVNLGNFLASGGDTDRARAAFASAVTMDPFDSRARFGLARLDEAAGRMSDAFNGYRAGLQTDPGNAQAREAVVRLTGKPIAQPSH